MEERRPFDLGLQGERTALAWQRTALALLVGSATSLRLLPPIFGAWSLTVGIVGLITTTALWCASNTRARQVELSLRTSTALPGGMLLAVTTGCAASVGAICLVYATVH